MEIKNIIQKDKKDMKNYKSEIQKNLKSITVEILDEINKYHTKSLNYSEGSNNNTKLMFLGSANFSDQLIQFKNSILKWIRRVISSIKLENKVILEQQKLELENK